MPDSTAQDQPITPAPILAGGPGGEMAPAPPQQTPPADPPSPPSRVKMKLGGREVELEPEIAEVVQSREREFQQKLSEHSNELGELRRFRQSVQQTVTPPAAPQAPELETLLFENPKAALSRLRQEITEDVTQQYRQDQHRQQFWRDFYRANDDLDSSDELMVQAVMSSHWGELQALPMSEAIKRIGDMTRNEILRISKKLKTGGETLPVNRAIVEGAGVPAPKRTASTEPDDGIHSLSDVLRKRREQRRNPGAVATKG